MKKFNIRFEMKERSLLDMEVEASSEEEAADKAEKIFEKNEQDWNSATDFSYVDREIIWMVDEL